MRTALDLPAVLEEIAGRDPARLTRREFNQHVIAGRAPGWAGMFIAALRRHLRHRGVVVAFDEHELIAEITRPPPHTRDDPMSHVADPARDRE